MDGRMDEKREGLEKQSDSPSLEWFNSARSESTKRERERYHRTRG